MVLLLLPAALRAAPPAAAPKPAPDTPGVYVIVYGLGSGHDNVYLGFPQAVSDQTARALLADIARRGGWGLREVKIESYDFISWYEQQMAQAEHRTPRPGPRQTIASCVTSGVVDYRKGWLRLEPFVRALTRYPRLHLVFTVGPTFRFRGPASFGNAAVQAVERYRQPIAPTRPGERAYANTVSYSYDVKLSGPELPADAFPQEPTGAAAPQQVASRRGANPWLVLVVIALLAAAAGLVTYAYLGGRRRAAAAAPDAATPAEPAPAAQTEPEASTESEPK